MDQHKSPSANVVKEGQTSEPEDMCVTVDSVALDRLIEEVRTDEVTMSRHYNRTYNRHNR